jgi:hypothetical protein
MIIVLLYIVLVYTIMWLFGTYAEFVATQLLK